MERGPVISNSKQQQPCVSFAGVVATYVRAEYDDDAGQQVIYLVFLKRGAADVHRRCRRLMDECASRAGEYRGLAQRIKSGMNGFVAWRPTDRRAGAAYGGYSVCRPSLGVCNHRSAPGMPPTPPATLCLSKLEPPSPPLFVHSLTHPVCSLAPSTLAPQPALPKPATCIPPPDQQPAALTRCEQPPSRA